jgi:ABC-type glycerol-3-phosphate transport system substrate-binding protein
MTTTQTATVNIQLVTTAAPNTDANGKVIGMGPASPADTMIQALANAFDQSHPGDTIKIQFVSNNSYKTVIQGEMDNGTEPQVFWTWGGGPLQQDIKQGRVTPLGTLSSSSYLSNFLPSSLGAVTVGKQVYGVPIEGTQPVYFFYNKAVFNRYNLAFPTTWTELLSDVATFKSHGITPIALGNNGNWPGLMFLEYLTDRIGGPAVAQALQSNAANAWDAPAVEQALNDISTLVSDGAFESGFSGKSFGVATDSLVTKGQAAMQLMGDWDIPSILGEDPGFVNGNQLGMATFPTVTGGTGNPNDLAGNTASYVSLSTNATPAQKAVAQEFFATALASPSYAQAEAQAGQVPVTSGASSMFTGSMTTFDTTIYDDVQSAPSFQYSWDQAMTKNVSATMLQNLGGLFAGTENSTQFITALGKQAATNP